MSFVKQPKDVTLKKGEFVEISVLRKGGVQFCVCVMSFNDTDLTGRYISTSDPDDKKVGVFPWKEYQYVGPIKGYHEFLVKHP